MFFLPFLFVTHRRQCGTPLSLDMSILAVHVCQNKTAQSWQHGRPISHNHNRTSSELLEGKFRHIKGIQLPEPTGRCDGVNTVAVSCPNKYM